MLNLLRVPGSVWLVLLDVAVFMTFHVMLRYGMPAFDSRFVAPKIQGAGGWTIPDSRERHFVVA